MQVHKLSPEIIAAKDTTKLPFRPIFAGERWILNPYNKIIMEFLRALNREIEKKLLGNVNVMTKNGYEAAERLQSADIKMEGSEMLVFVTADMCKILSFVNILEK